MYLPLVILLAVSPADSVTLLKTPDAGIQPQAIRDQSGTLHLLYYKGDPKGGDLYYVRRHSGNVNFSVPIRVNSKPESAIAAGTVRGGQLAVGRNNRVHVAWNGGAGTGGMQYARLNDAGTAFDDQKNLMQVSSVPDGGCSVASDDSGRVIVAWHAVPSGERGEEHRKMWIARSTDDGKTFAAESSAWSQPTGACGCCSTRALAVGKDVYLLYRSATMRDQRDVYLLHGKDHNDFQGRLLHRWKTATCPMSTFALAAGPSGMVALWETQGQIYFSTIKSGSLQFSQPVEVPGLERGRKHPALAFNPKGDMILVWTEGTGWQRGGDLVWQVYNAMGQPIGKQQRLERGVPVWGLPTVVAHEHGFLILH